MFRGGIVIYTDPSFLVPM